MLLKLPLNLTLRSPQLRYGARRRNELRGEGNAGGRAVNPVCPGPHPVSEPVKHSAFAVPVRQPWRAAPWTRPGVSAHTASQPDTTDSARQRTSRARIGMARTAYQGTSQEFHGGDPSREARR